MVVKIDPGPALDVYCRHIDGKQKRTPSKFKMMTRT